MIGTTSEGYPFNSICGRGVGCRPKLNRSMVVCHSVLWVFHRMARSYAATTRSLTLDVGCFDYRPPLLNLCFLQRTKRLWRLLLQQGNLQSEIGHPLAHRRLSQCTHDRSVEPDDRFPGCTRRCPKCIPNREIEA